MPLEFELATLNGLPDPIKALYVPKDDKFVLDVKGVVSAEFRERNIALSRTLEAYGDISPDAAKAALAKVAAGDTDDVVKLKLDLATERAARLAAQQTTDAGILRAKIAGQFLAAGGRPEAADYVCSQAAQLFTVVDGVVKAVAGKFSTAKPGDPLSVDEWMGGQTKDFPHLFKVSSGAGADPKSSLFTGRHAKANELHNPTPQQLGQYADAIRSGKMKIVTD